jgi:hypothetical protein
LKTERDKLMG